MFGLDTQPAAVRCEFKLWAENIHRTGVAAMAGPRNVESESHGYDCYLSTPGEKAVSAAWHQAQAHVIERARPTELILLVRSLEPIWHENTQTRGRTGACGDWDDIDCPLKWLRESALHWMKNRASRMSFAELVQLYELMSEAELPTTPSSLGFLPARREGWPPPEVDPALRGEQRMWALFELYPGSAIAVGTLYEYLYGRDLVLTHGPDLALCLGSEDDIDSLRAALHSVATEHKAPIEVSPDQDAAAAWMNAL